MANITPITTPFMFNISVNAYLLKGDAGFILIDTGSRSRRGKIESALREAGCSPGDLKLIVLTHGDFDHCGNAAYLRETFGAKIAMHSGDRGMVEQGDMFYNRKPPNTVVRFLIGLLLRLRPSDQFEPDIWLKEGDTLEQYGLAARVIEIPGHSRGSIGILTADNSLLGGDLFGNTGKHPQLWTMIDDPQAAAASVEKLRALPIEQVYPGHGKPFTMQVFLAHYDKSGATDTPGRADPVS